MTATELADDLRAGFAAWELDATIDADGETLAIARGWRQWAKVAAPNVGPNYLASGR